MSKQAGRPSSGVSLVKRRATVRRVPGMSWSGASIGGGEWTWRLFVTVRKDGTFSTTARCFSSRSRGDSPGGSDQLPGRYRLRTAEQVKEGIEHLFAIGEFDRAPDWPGLLDNLRKLDAGIADALQRLLDREERKEARREREYLKQKPIQEWVCRAKWPPDTATGAGGVVSAVANAILRNAVVRYTQKYLSDNGRLP